MTGRLPAIPHEGRPLTYISDGRACVGQWIGAAAQPPKHRKGMPPAWVLPDPHAGWVMAADGLVFVARLRGAWRAVPIPAGLPDPGTLMASQHHRAPDVRQDTLWPTGSDR